ncbi:superoxide dismutase [Hyphococcus luteus]|uniref:Superoxide dismutase n=1 Tax=Hyphococcus luteus TaxID=2058213 RepID=A0A2S7KB56_9PROT|nr:superoxide dismutase [Marinicaulis flavus]PQA89741.1 superoxide dismutase [Fe] [Marinicaulis flavus]
MAIELPSLPFSRDSLAPHISKQTLDYHYGKHHQGYVNNLNKLIAGRSEDHATLEEIIKEAAGDPDKAGIFNNAAQIWNHTFYWRSMTPSGGGAPAGDVEKAIDASFGGVEGFKEAFAKVARTQFGSGWAWLVAKDGKLDVQSTSNAETPLTEPGVAPLLVMDVWEHAYYLDYQNDRPGYIDVFIDKLINWAFVNENLHHA